MAITLNKQAIKCEQIALASGSITPNSSPNAHLYDISRQWRRLCHATKHLSTEIVGYTEKEEKAAEVILATLTYLQRIGCANIERLLLDTIEHHARQIE